MSRLSLLMLQILVAVAAVTLWYVLTTYPVFGRISDEKNSAFRGHARPHEHGRLRR